MLGSIGNYNKAFIIITIRVKSYLIINIWISNSKLKCPTLFVTFQIKIIRNYFIPNKHSRRKPQIKISKLLWSFLLMIALYNVKRKLAETFCTSYFNCSTIWVMCLFSIEKHIYILF